MKIAIASSSPVGIPVLASLLSSNHEVLFAISNPNKATGRGQSVVANEFAQRASELGLAVHSPSDSSDITKLLQEQPVDLVVTVAYGQLIKSEALSIPPFGWINIHFSRLPQYRGAAPVQYAILNQESETGVSIFQLDTGMDTGPIYEMWSTPILPTDTTETLLEKMSEESAARIPQVLDSINDGKEPKIQSEIGISPAPKLTKLMGKLSVKETRNAVVAKVRALGSNPGTFFTFRGERLGVTSVEISYADNEGLTPGALVATKHELLLNLQDGLIRLITVIPQGKKSMSGADFARGVRISAGESCE